MKRLQLIILLLLILMGCKEKTNGPLQTDDSGYIEVLGTIDADSGNIDEQIERYRGQVPDSLLEKYKAAIHFLVDSLDKEDSVNKIKAKK